MQYAVIRSGGKQYKVSVGDTLKFDKLNSQEGKNIAFDVLLLVSDGKAKIGKPVVSGVRVEGKLIENIKGEKTRVSKFKAKSRYRKSMGFRPALSVVKIERITNGRNKIENKAEKPAKTASKPKTE